MISALWNWMDRRLNLPIASHPASGHPASRYPAADRYSAAVRAVQDGGVVDPSPAGWARRQWEDFEAGGRWYLRHAPDMASCPACYVMQDVEDARYLAGVHPSEDERSRWRRNLADSKVVLAALGDCRCGYQLTTAAAAVHAVDELRRHQEGASE